MLDIEKNLWFFTNKYEDKIVNLSKRINKRIGSRLRYIRLLRRVAIKTISEEIEIHENTYYNYEIGKGPIKASHLYQISKILEAPIEDFFTEIDEGHPSFIYSNTEKELINSLREFNGTEREEIISSLKQIIELLLRKRRGTAS